MPKKLNLTLAFCFLYEQSHLLKKNSHAVPAIPAPYASKRLRRRNKDILIGYELIFWCK